MRFDTSPAALLGAAAALLFASAARGDDPVRWRTDYNAARKEAAEAGKPLFLQIGSDDCVHCRRMEASTLRDPGVTGLLGSGYVPLKVDGRRDAGLVKALKVQVYPTTVLAGPDGTIHAVVQGYVAADPLREHLKAAAATSAEDLKLARELADAAAAERAGEYAKALGAAQRVALVGKGRPAEAKANELLEDIEKHAADRLAAALAGPPRPAEATRPAIAAVVRTFPGTRAAARAEAQLAAAGVRFETPVAGLPGPLLGVARELVEKGEYADALGLLGYLARGPADAPETRTAGELAAAVAADPAKLAAAARQAGEQAAALQIALADAHLSRGEQTAAVAALEHAIRLCPTGGKAEAATAKLTRIRDGTPATPAALQRDGR
jgi:thioredoxin-related protein